MHVTSTKTGKLEFLDGLRGLMAFNVILNHFVVVYYPQMYYQEYAEATDSLLRLFALTPLSALLNGNIAVQYFFVLTGFLAGRTCFTKDIPPEKVPTRLLHRYFRLLPVVAAATIFTFLTMRFDLQWHLRIADRVANTWFLPSYCNFTERLISLPEQIFVAPFTRSGSNYVGPFWTICYEFWGYGIVMITCLLLKNRKYRHFEYIIAAFLLHQEAGVNYVPFILGALVADFQYNKTPCFLSSSHLERVCSPKKETLGIIFLLGSYLACCPMYFTTLHAWFAPYFGIDTSIVRAFGMTLLFYVLLNIPKIQNLLSHPRLVSLGDLSFEIYAFHWPIMLSFQAWAFSHFIQKMSYDIAALSAFVLTLPVIYIISRLAHIALGKINCVYADIIKKAATTPNQ